MSFIQGDPKAYYQAATNCFDAAEALRDSFRYVFSELGSCGSMAGRDEDGRTWATSYDESARKAVSLFDQTFLTLRAYGTALNNLGFEHAKSDASIKGTTQPERPQDPNSNVTFGPYILPASAANGVPQGLAEVGVDVLDAINCPLPDGNTDTLAKAADAWDRLGTIYQNTNAKDKITVSIGLFSDVVSDDVVQVREDLKTIERSIAELLNTCLQIKKICLDYKESIEELRKEIKSFLEAIVAEAAIDALISIIATCVTGPVGAVIAGAKAVESARRWSTKIKAAVAAWRARKGLQLKGLADDARAALDRATKEVTDLCNRLGIARTKMGADGRLYSRIGNRTNREIIDAGDHLPMTRETIESLAKKYGIDLEGIEINIANTPDDIAYYDFMKASASTQPESINLAPSSFADEESLVRNLVHERVHIDQYRQGRVTDTGVTEALEKEAYDADENFWQTHGKS